MGFLEWLQSPPKPISLASTANYLYAVKHHLVCHGLDTTNQVSSAVLSKQKKGNMNTFLADEHNLEANRRMQRYFNGGAPTLGLTEPPSRFDLFRGSVIRVHDVDSGIELPTY